MPNRAPTLLGLSPSATFAENAVNAAPALLDGDLTFTDLDGNFAGGIVLVSGLLAEDRVSIRNQGFGAGQIGLFGVNVTFAGVAIGTFSGGVGDTLTINLNSSATSTAVEALLENLSYGNVSDDPTELRTLTIEVRDGDGAPVVRTASFSGVAGGDNPFNAIDVGLNSAPAFGDIDGDGDKDLVVGDRTGIFHVYRNNGGSFVELIGTANPLNLVDVGGYSRPVFVDIDGDGDSDLVVGSTAGTFRTFINSGGTFTEAAGAANPFNGLSVGSEAAPAFTDFDNDGDLDLVSGEVFGTLKAYRNTGGVFTALTGTDNPFNGLDIGFFSTPSFTDIDGDGDDDLLASNTSGSISLHRNNGGSFTPFTGEPHPFSETGSFGGYATPTFVDVDGDGDSDAVVGRLNGTLDYLRNVAPQGRSIEVHVTPESDVPTLADVASGVSYLENAVNAAPVHLDTDVDFSPGSSPLDGGKLIVSGLIPEDRISIIEGGSITVAGNQVSYNGAVIGTFTGGQGTSFIVTFAAGVDATEGEALIESLGYANASDTPTASRSLHFNVVDSVGGALDGALALTAFPVNPFALVPTSLNNVAPALTDLDADGDLDLVVGELFGQLRTYRNDGGAYVELGGSDNPFASIDVGFNSMPVFVDIDGDGDKDLMLGSDAIPGRVWTFRNDAGAWVELTGADDPFVGVSFGRGMSPAPADMDGDGDIDILFGTFTNSTPGQLRYFENDGAGYVENIGSDNPFASFTFSGYPAPAWIDIDGDGDLDLTVGSSGPGFDASIRTFRNDGGTFTELTGPANPFGAIDLTDGFQVRPTFADLDGDGDPDVVLGIALNGGVRAYRNDASFGPSIIVNVTAEADVASLEDLAGSASFAENAVNAAPALIDADVDFGAGSGTIAGAVLTVSGLLGEDRVSIRSEGPIAVSGGTVSYLGTDIGTVAGGIGGTLTVTLTAAASAASIEAVLERLSYANASDTPTASRVLTVDYVDGGGGGLTGGAKSITVQVAAENDAPQIAGLAATLIVDENATPVLLDGDVAFIDPEANLAGGSLTVSGLLAEDRVAIRDQGLGPGTISLFGGNVIHDGVAIGTFSGGIGSDLVVALNSAATVAAVDALIQNLTYASASAEPTSGRTLTLTVGDALGAAVSNAIAVTVSANNDAPTLAATGANPTFTEGDSGSDLFDGVTASTIEAGQTFTSMTLTVTEVTDGASEALSIDGSTLALTNGNSIVTATNGLTVNVSVAGTTATVSFSGAALSAGQIETLIDNMEYFNGDDDPTDADRVVTITQLVDSGAGTAPDDNSAALSLSSTVDVEPVDDPGTAGNDGFNVDEDDTIDDAGLFGNDSDVDDPLAVFAVNGATGDVGTQIALGGGLLTVNSNGLFDFDPDGNYGYLISAATALATGAVNSSAGESFTYDLVNGSAPASVTITIDGVDSADDELWGDSSSNTITDTVDADIFNLSQGGDDTANGLGGDDIFHFGAEFTPTDVVNGGANGAVGDALVLEGDYATTDLALLATSFTHIERLVVLGGFSYDIASHDANVGSGETLIVDGSALGPVEGLDFDGSAESDGRFVLTGGGGDDALTGGGGNDVIFAGAGSNAYDGNDGSDRIDFSLATGAVEVDLGAGTVSDNGFGGADSIAQIEDVTGSAFDDILTGDGAGNRLDGGLGADTMTGGDGDDAYTVDNAGDQAIETSGSGGTDIVRSSVSFTLGAHVENLDLVGLDNINGTGNDEGNRLTGNAGNNRLDGGLGADFMRGGLGNDTYVVDNAGDVVSELAGQGTDTVQSAISYALGAAVENLILTGAAAIDGTGNLFANMLVGNSNDNLLDGSAGADTMNGGLGNDTYLVDNVGDQVFETSAAGGFDIVHASASFTIGSNIETLVLVGLNAISGTGNTLDNTITGNDAANLLDGGAGADTMTGGLGNDTYVVDNGGDVIIELAGGGIDTVRTTFSFTLDDELENLTLTSNGNVGGTGNGASNILTGNSGANRLDGGGGADTMQGGLGNDVYVVDNGLDKVIEAAGGGTDTVNSSITHQIAAEVENLVLTGTAAINGFGNALANTVTGNDAGNRLDGGLGADTLKGGLGDDIYVVDTDGDVISELAGQGTDTVQSAVSFTLTAALENLTLTGSGDTSGTGNLFANNLLGNSGANRLDGGGGADRMNGGLGDDTYVVDNGGDVVIETSVVGGSDTVESAITYTLGATLENLTLTGANPINGTGNALANILNGNGQANILSGLAGDDQLHGGGGHDQLRGGTGNDTLEGGAGNDGFYFENALLASNVDDVLDFAAVDDTIFLDDAVFTGLAAGALAAGAFQAGSSALEADDRILYDSGTGEIFYDADGSGGGSSAILFATVAPGTAITNLDFVVF